MLGDELTKKFTMEIVGVVKRFRTTPNDGKGCGDVWRT